MTAWWKLQNQDNIKMDITEIAFEGVDGIKIAEDVMLGGLQ